MAHSVHPVQRLPPELIRKIGDQLVGIKEWVTISQESLPDALSPSLNVPEYFVRPPARKIDFIGLRTMPSLATASRFFLEATLDALWDTLPDYGILVYLLPKDAWAVDEVVEGLDNPNIPLEIRGPPFQYVSIVRPLTEDEFKRVEYYAPRVKRIQELCPLFPGRFQGSVTYESSVLSAFASRWSPENPLFPNLRIVDVSPANDQYDLYYRFFHVLFGPRLQMISDNCVTRMDKGMAPDDYQQMLMRLQESAPHLSHLKLYVDIPPYSPVIISAMSTAIRSFKHLVSARTGALPITMEALHHLAELPHLEVIEVRAPDTTTEGDVAFLRPTRFDKFFPSLRVLRLVHQFDFAPVSRIVQHVRSSQLEIIHVLLLEMDAPSNTILPFLSVVIDRENSENIKELSIHASTEEGEGSSQFTEEHLEPLFALKSLTHLRLHLSCTFNLSDAALGRAARAWPNIHLLELGPNRAQKGTQVTLAALIPFAQHCPKLQTLGFTLDADLSRLPADLRESRASVGSVQHALRVLRVGRAGIADPQGVAEFLVDLFPRLECTQDANRPSYAVVLAEIDGEPRDELAAEAKCRNRWKAVCEECIPALARERGIDRTSSSDERDGPVVKSWHMGGKRRRVDHPN